MIVSSIKDLTNMVPSKKVSITNSGGWNQIKHYSVGTCIRFYINVKNVNFDSSSFNYSYELSAIKTSNGNLEVISATDRRYTRSLKEGSLKIITINFKISI